jgi:GT2 family glycosyltransferase
MPAACVKFRALLCTIGSLAEPIVSVVVPTLRAGPELLDCVYSLDRQTQPGVEIIVVDNSGRGLARQSAAARLATRLIENETNLGFGAAVNAGFRASRAPYLATINDDAVAHPQWLERLIQAMNSQDRVGMCASQIRLAGQELLDSAGMLVSGDGSSKQRGQFESPARFARREEVLLPSACAALYRRAMLEEIGLFDEEFFLYCEDTDLGLRARWAGWKCLYVPDAVVEHAYSSSAGQASPLKAYYVERNRLFVLVKNYPADMLWRAPFFTVARYFWHLLALSRNEGLAGQFHAAGRPPIELAYLAVRAHVALLFHLPRLWRQRKKIRQTARLSSRQFRELLRAHWISPRQVAAL